MTHNKAAGSGTWHQHFDEIITQVAALYGQLDALSLQQQTLVEAADMDRLLGLLGQRQQLIAALEALVPQFDDLRRTWDKQRTSLPEHTRRDFDRRLSAIEHMAGAIAYRDQQAGTALDAARDAIASELAGLQTGNAAVAAYAKGNTLDAGPRFQDRKG